MGCPGKMNKKITIIIIFLIIAVSLFISLSSEKNNNKLYSKKRFLMDTTVEIKVVGSKKSNNIINETFEVMKEWEEELNRYHKNSLVFKLNRNSQNGIKVSDQKIKLFQEIKKYAKLTDGYFDPTIAPLIDLWGFGKETNQIPAQNDIKSALQLVDYNDIKVDEEENKIYLPKKTKIDLGAVAKGYIIDRAYEFLKANNINNFFINAGGNIRVSGMNTSENRLWNIGISKPRDSSQIYKNYILSISEGAVATSGDYERYFIKNSKRYSHLINPKTGYPSQELQSVTIYTSKAISADIFSTSLFIMGWDKAKERIKNSDEIAGLLIKEGEIWYSDDFKDIFAN